MSAGLITKFSHKNSHLHHVKCKLHNRRLLASSTRVDDTNNNEGVEGTCPSAQPDPRTYLCERTLSPPSACLDTKNAHAQPFYIRGTLLILAHTQSHLLKTCTSLEIKANHIQKDSYARVHIISFPPRFTFFFYLSHSQRRGLPSYRTHTYIHIYIHIYIYISIYLYTTKVNTHEDLRWRTRPGYRRDTAKTVDQEHRELAVWFWNVRNRDRFFCCVGATMKRQISREPTVRWLIDVLTVGCSADAPSRTLCRPFEDYTAGFVERSFEETSRLAGRIALTRSIWQRSGCGWSTRSCATWATRTWKTSWRNWRWKCITVKNHFGSR